MNLTPTQYLQKWKITGSKCIVFATYLSKIEDSSSKNRVKLQSRHIFAFFKISW